MKTFDELKAEVDAEREQQYKNRRIDYFNVVEERLKNLVFSASESTFVDPYIELRQSEFVEDVVAELEKDSRWNIQKSIDIDGSTYYLVSIN